MVALIPLFVAIIQLIIKLPELAAFFERIFGKWERLSPLKVAREIPKLRDACKAKLESLNLNATEKTTLGEVCPLFAYETDFDERRGIAA